ncbi:MAG: DNA-binding transcriptional ArsR family regulator [Paracoccaceae bacterium]|jgi:DNA-binding transcriptional ArsR family regulator
MSQPDYTEDERRQFYRCMTRIFQMERELGGTMIDAIILRAAAIGRLEDRPMSVSSLASYVSLPRQTVSRRVHRLTKVGMLTTRRDGNRTIVDTTEKARRRNTKFVNDAIAETVEFVRRLDDNRPK